MIPPNEINNCLLLDPPLNFSLDQTIDMVIRLKIGGFVFNNLIVRRKPTDTPQTLAARYHKSADRLKPEEPNNYVI